MAGILALGSCAERARDDNGPTAVTTQATTTCDAGTQCSPQANPGPTLLCSGTISSGTVGLAFTNLISTTYANYELRLRSVYPQTLGGAAYVFLFMHLSNDQGCTWDYNSCPRDSDGNVIPGCTGANYSFCNSFTIPGGSGVFTRNPGQGALDEEFELTQQGSHATGVCGSIRFSDPTVDNIFKQFQWDTSYFGPNNFCRESGAGIYYGFNGSGTPFNAFRIVYAVPGNNPTYVAFGGGSYSLWASN